MMKLLLSSHSLSSKESNRERESGRGGDRREKPQTTREETQRGVGGGKAWWIWKKNKKSAYSVEKDLWPNADVVVNSLVLCLSQNFPIVALGNSAIQQSTSCLHVNVRKWLPTQWNLWCRQHTPRFRFKIALKVLIYTSAWFPGIKSWIFIARAQWI